MCEKGQRQLPLFFAIFSSEGQSLRGSRLLDRIQAKIDYCLGCTLMKNTHDSLPPKDSTGSIQPDVELDLRGVICPYNFVKTKLKLETMEGGQILSVLLDDGDPIRNVPQSVRNEGHTILSQEQINRVHRVIIRKSAAG